MATILQGVEEDSRFKRANCKVEGYRKNHKLKKGDKVGSNLAS